MPSDRLDWGPIHARLHQTLRSLQLLRSSQSILIALSGGQDSLCLSRLLLDLRSRWDWQLAIAHCNHRWRADSDANAEHVQHLAQQWQVPFFLSTAEIPPRGEAAARDWRYGRLIEIATTAQYDVIVTGHTASDRAESLLYNLVRGCGSDGLSTLSWQRDLTPQIQLVRPLLGLTRAETAEFCQVHHLPIWLDQTNQETDYARNRLRLEVFPQLRTINPQAERHLAQTAELLAADVTYLEAMAEQLYEKVQANSDLNRHMLKAEPLALQRRVARKFLQAHLSQQPNRNQIEKIVALLDAPNRTQTDPFPGGAIARVEQNWIRLVAPTPQE